MALAQTGTGKTAAFGLPLLNLTDQDFFKPQTIILSPTRELGNQIATDLKTFSKHMKGVKIVSVYGGANISTQIRELKRGCNIIVDTLRVKIKQFASTVSLGGGPKIVILDEADYLNPQSTQPALRGFIEEFSKNCRFIFTCNYKNRIIQPLHSRLKITVGSKNEGSKNIDHKYYVVQNRNRFPALKMRVDKLSRIFGLIFCRTKRDTQSVAEKLIEDGYSAGALHGDFKISVI